MQSRRQHRLNGWANLPHPFLVEQGVLTKMHAPPPACQTFRALESRRKEFDNLAIRINENGEITAKVPLWWELPTVTLRKEISGTEYSITGSYDGTQALPSKLLNLIMREMEDDR